MVKNTKLSIKLCSIINSVVSGSHDILDTLFINAGASGAPPALAHHSKWKTWLKQTSNDPEADAHAVFGKIIEEFMEIEPDYDLEPYSETKQKVIEALEDDGLRYVKGGIIEPIHK